MNANLLPGGALSPTTSFCLLHLSGRILRTERLAAVTQHIVLVRISPYSWEREPKVLLAFLCDNFVFLLYSAKCLNNLHWRIWLHHLVCFGLSLPPPPWHESPPPPPPTSVVDQDLSIIEAFRSHSDTRHSVRLLWASDQPGEGNFIWQQKTLSSDQNMLKKLYKLGSALKD